MVEELAMVDEEGLAVVVRGAQMIKACIGNLMCHSDSDEVSRGGRFLTLAEVEGAELAVVEG